MARTVRAVLAAALLFSFVALATAPTVSADTATGVTYLGTTQDDFGGWDGDPLGDNEFTTSEAILGIAKAAQTGASWSTSQAFAAVDAFADEDAPNNTPLDYMSAAATGQVFTPGKAAKWIVNVAAPLGLDPENFLGTGIDLVAAMGPPGADGSFGTGANFNGAAYAALASFLVNGSVPAQTITYLLDAQTAGGGWAFDGLPTSDADTDSTALTLEALVPAGIAATDPVVQSALAFLARDVAPAMFGDEGYDNAAGHWLAFGAPSPEGTSRALLAIAALGFDPATSCWRDTARPDLAGTPYTSPIDALLSLQAGDGSWPSFGPSFTTAQAIHGLEVGTWRPVVVGAAQTCQTPIPPAPIPEAVGVVPTFTG